MALQHLIVLVSQRCAQRGLSICELAQKHDWEGEIILPFLLCLQAPPKRILRVLAKELAVEAEYLEEVLLLSSIPRP